MVISHQQTIEILPKSNANIFEAHKKIVVESAKKIIESNVKVEKNASEVKEMSSNMTKFMIEFQTSSDKNVTKVNKVIEGFCESLQKENEAFSILHFGLQRDNADHHTAIANTILRMQIDLPYEKIMDSLVESTHKVKVIRNN